jgi:hypothetical protein
MCERDRDRETETERQTQRDRETERQRDRETERKRDRETERERGGGEVILFHPIRQVFFSVTGTSQRRKTDVLTFLFLFFHFLIFQSLLQLCK